MTDTSYITTDLLKNALRSADFNWKAEEQEFADLAVSAASRKIDAYTKRSRNGFALAEVASARRYTVADYTDRLVVDEFDPATPIIVQIDEDGDGSYSTTWDDSTYDIEPLNVVEGEPCDTIVSFAPARFWPNWSAPRRASVKVTAKWGWPAVPDEVQQATLLVAIDCFKSKSTPFGVAGINDFGSIRVRENAQAVMLLSNFVRWSKAFA